jgi:hypothetical protein
MNALANSQQEELKKFLDGEGHEIGVSFARYTGQENQEEREKIRSNPPDILLTNFMMLELLMTRQSELDRRVVENCRGLKFIVLDELHTYRGRQGADVAMRSSARTTTSSYEIVRALGAPHAAEVASYGSRMLSSRPRSSGYRKYEITRREPTFISAVRVIPGGIRNPSGKSRSRISVRSMSTR